MARSVSRRGRDTIRRCKYCTSTRPEAKNLADSRLVDPEKDSCHLEEEKNRTEEDEEEYEEKDSKDLISTVSCSNYYIPLRILIVDLASVLLLQKATS